MGGLHAIRAMAPGQFRQTALRTLLEHRRAVLIDAGFANAICQAQMQRANASLAMALYSCLRWLKMTLPNPCRDDPRLEVTVSIAPWVCVELTPRHIADSHSFNVSCTADV